MNVIKVGVIGAVGSTATTLKSLHQHNFNIIGVLGHEPVDQERVSGLYDLRSLSAALKLPHAGFQKINSSHHLNWMEEKQPDIIFAVGLSQLLSDEWLSIPTLGCIGFHPTLLPRGRGRAPLAWLVLEERRGAANFFLMGKGADDGPIFVQEPFELDKDDNASTTSKKINEAIKAALDRWLPELKKGIWDPKPQNEAEASWYGKRNPEDGLINWNYDAKYIDRLIKATTRPHPGAYTYFQHNQIIIWSSQIENKIPIKGVVGRILIKDEDKGYLVQCGKGLIWLRNIELPDNMNLKIGDKLGWQVEDEIYKMWLEINRLKTNE